MELTFPNNFRLHKATLLFLLVFLPLFSAIRNLQGDSEKSGLTGNIDVLTGISQFQGPIPHFPKNLRVDLGTILPVAPPEKSSSEKKPNVGAVVGYTSLLVFLLVATFVCIYLNRRSASQWSVRQQQVVVQPGVPREENPPQGRQQVEMLQGRNQNPDRKDDKKQVEKKVEGPKGNGDDNKEGKKQPQDEEVVGRRERVKDGNEGKELPHKEKAVVQSKRVREGKQQEEAPPDEGVARQNKREMEGKKQELAPRDEGVAKQKKRGVEGKQQLEPPRDEGVAKQKKRGREGKRQQPLEEDVGRQYKTGNEEEQNGKGVEAKEEPEKEQFGGQPGKGRDRKEPREVAIEQGNSLRLPNKYTYTYLTIATNNFDPKNKIGEGGYGNVYKGILSNGTKVAVKCLKLGVMKDDFKNEVEFLGRADHSNLIKLIGYCDEGLFSILVYEYMGNGSLDKWIFHDKTLSWTETKNIIQGIAQGLVHLHENCENKILHRDLKPHNVVLDENKNAKLCDFGLAKLIDKNQSSTWTFFAGTPRYMAPEVMKQKRITEKVDVYSFGIVVLEVVFRKRYDYLVIYNQNTNSVEVKLHDIIKNLSEEMQRNGKEIEEFGKLAMRCLREKPEERPTMSVTLAAIQSLNAKATRN